MLPSISILSRDPNLSRKPPENHSLPELVDFKTFWKDPFSGKSKVRSLFFGQSWEVRAQGNGSGSLRPRRGLGLGVVVSLPGQIDGVRKVGPNDWWGVVVLFVSNVNPGVIHPWLINRGVPFEWGFITFALLEGTPP